MDVDYIKKIEEDINEIKHDVKSLMLFMAVQQAENKKRSMFASGFISFCVSVIVLMIGRLL